MKNKIYLAFVLLLFILSLNGAANAEADIKERFNIYYNNGVNLYKANKYTEAINEFKKVLRYVPYDANVKNALYTAYTSRAKEELDVKKAPKKAINDLKSALFYMKYWTKDDKTEPSAVLSNENSLKALQKKYENLSAESRLQNAKNLRAQGEMAAAGYDFNQLKTNQKFTFTSLVSLSDIYKGLNNRQMALETIREASKINPKDGNVHYKYALLLDDIGNIEAANDEYMKAFENGDNVVLERLEALWMAKSTANPKDTSSLINLGAIYQKQKQYDLAKAQYLKAQSINSKDPLASLNLASLYYETGDTGAAIGLYRKILASNPNNEAAKAGLDSVISSLTGEKLTSYLKDEALKNPYNYDKQFAYAYELHKNKAYTEAVTYYKKAIAINPKMPEPYINIAQIYRLTNETAKASAVINHGLSNLPDNKELITLRSDINTETAAGLYNTAVNYFNAGDYNKALENYLKIEIQTPEVLYSIASCYFELGENKKAIEYFKKVLEKTQNDTKAMYFIANAAVNLSDNKTAVEYLNKILAIEPNNADAKNALNSLKQGEEGKELEMAINLYENKKYKEAMALFDKIISSNPKNAYALYYKGAIYDETSKTDLAIEEYKKAIAADSGFSLAYYMLAVALDTKEDYKGAVSYYEKYLSSKAGTDDDLTKYAKDRVKELKEYLEQK